MSAAVVTGIVLGIVVVAAVVLALVDLARRDVAYLPKWAWAAVIVLLSAVGVVAYLLLGRIPADGEDPVLPRLVRGNGDARSDGTNGELMAVGMVIGLLVGTALEQIALGMAIGLAVGAAADAVRAHRSDR
jgi:hypothetical protein